MRPIVVGGGIASRQFKLLPENDNGASVLARWMTPSRDSSGWCWRGVGAMFIHGMAAFINRDVKLPPFTHNKITSGYYGRLPLLLPSAAALFHASRVNSKDYNIAKPQVVD